MVVLRCQNIFRFGVALGEVSLANAFHISAWLGRVVMSKNSNVRSNNLQLGIPKQDLQVTAVIGKMNLSVEPKVANC